jgi:hypothetical protein
MGRVAPREAARWARRGAILAGPVLRDVDAAVDCSARAIRVPLISTSTTAASRANAS